MSLAAVRLTVSPQRSLVPTCWPWSWPEVLRRAASLDSLDAFSTPLRA